MSLQLTIMSQTKCPLAVPLVASERSGDKGGTKGGLTLSKKLPYFILSAFLLGIGLHSFYPTIRVPVLIWYILGLALLLAVCISYGLKNYAPFLIVLALALGVWRFDISLPDMDELAFGWKQRIGRVEEQMNGLFGRQFYVKLETGHKILISTDQFLILGETITFECALSGLVRREQDSDSRFAALWHRAQAKCGASNLQRAAPPAWWDTRQMFHDWRTWSNKRIASVLPGDQGVLIAGMLYGERNMTQESQDMFRRAGLTHLIAVSGSNITIVATIMFAIFLGTGLWRSQAFWFTSGALLAYVGLTGFSASVARAAFMGWLVLLARHLGRKPKIWYLLLLAAVILCVIDPWMLFFDAGFALSFLATMGLMLWTPIMTRKLDFVPAFAGLQEAAATTFSATLMTMPYSALMFGKISLAGLFTNLVAVPLVPWAMLFGTAAAVWGRFQGYTLVSLPALGVSQTIFLSAHIADIFPWLSIEVENINWMLIISIYILIVYFWFKLRQKNQLSTRFEIFCQKNSEQ